MPGDFLEFAPGFFQDLNDSSLVILYFRKFNDLAISWQSPWVFPNLFWRMEAFYFVFSRTSVLYLACLFVI